MADLEFNLGGNDYRASNLNTFAQFHLQRKVAPILPPLIPVFMKLASSSSEAAEGEVAEEGAQKHPFTSDIDGFAALLQPFADALAGMSKDDFEFIISTCMSTVRRRQGDAWHPVWRNNTCMFDDIGTSVMLQISVRILKDQLGPFFSALGFGRKPAPAQA